MANIYFDFETRSGKDLEKVDRHNYLYDPYADILCLAYRVGMNSPTQIWLPYWSDIAPEEFMNPEEHTFYAHNISFDAHVIEVLGPRYGFKPIPLDNQVDVMALAARYGYPQSLGGLTRTLNVKTPKSTGGKRLINRVTKPINLKDEGADPIWEFTSEDMKELVEYCRLDVDSMCQAIRLLPADNLSAAEHRIWKDTAIINSTGIRVDAPLAERIDRVVKRYMEDVSVYLPGWTGGEVSKITQVQRIRNWANSQGCNLHCLDKDILKEIFENEDEVDGYYLYGIDGREDILRVLELRYMYGSTSTAKFGKMVSYNYHGRIYGNLRYFGGHTGRETGNGVQIHNLPRAKYKDQEMALDLFRSMDIMDWKDDETQNDSPIDAAKKLIRAMILAPDGKMLAVLDFSQIEFITIIWYVRDYTTLDKFSRGEDIYVEYASKFYDLPMVNIDDPKRAFGKTVVLGSIYQMGGTKLYHTCKSYGLTFVEEEECHEATALFREMFKPVKRMWSACHKQAIEAVQNPGIEYHSHRCKFLSAVDTAGHRWLIVTLASGRAIYYNSPEIIKNSFGYDTIGYSGVNGTTKNWDALELSPGKLTENIIQATARDILMQSRSKIMDLPEDYDVIATIHDEVIVEVPAARHQAAWDHIKTVMESPPEWCSDLPLKVSGYCERRYRKD